MSHLSLVSVSAVDTSSRRSTALGDRIERFLCGDSDGGDLLRSLYDHVLDEPIPARLTEVLGRRPATP